MRNAAEGSPCDECDTMLINVNSPETPFWSERQQRFLAEYQRDPTIAPAARRAGVHRATVYRWMVHPAFVEAMRIAADAFFREHRAKVLAEEAARAEWRRQRERARHAMRCYYLARARAAKRR